MAREKGNRFDCGGRGVRLIVPRSRIRDIGVSRAGKQQEWHRAGVWAIRQLSLARRRDYIGHRRHVIAELAGYAGYHVTACRNAHDVDPRGITVFTRDQLSDQRS
jgi:hypothetical protein